MEIVFECAHILYIQNGKRQKYINVIRSYVNVYSIQLEPKKGLKHKCV